VTYGTGRRFGPGRHVAAKLSRDLLAAVFSARSARGWFLKPTDQPSTRLGASAPGDLWHPRAEEQHVFVVCPSAPHITRPSTIPSTRGG